ncbi:MAG: circadian clock protein KaiB [Nitrospinae bacterium]|nr:circadian clock protein KaiB [Nitrospinota bacterium]
MKFVLKLYVTGQTPNSLRAMQNLKLLVKEVFETEPDIKIIDVLKNPQAAEDDKIIATPTLVKELPQPMRKMIGDLSNTEKVLVGLGLIPKKHLEGNTVQ